jgi:hypothetical protein
MHADSDCHDGQHSFLCDHLYRRTGVYPICLFGYSVPLTSEEADVPKTHPGQHNASRGEVIERQPARLAAARATRRSLPLAAESSRKIPPRSAALTFRVHRH